MLFPPLIFGMLVAGIILCLGFYFGLRRSRVRERLQFEVKAEQAQSRAQEGMPFDIEFLPKEVVEKVEDKLGLKKGSAKVNELKKSLIQAGIYQDQAPSIYFGLKLGLTIALPVLSMPFIFGKGLPLVTSSQASFSVIWWRPGKGKSKRACRMPWTFWWSAWRPGRV